MFSFMGGKMENINGYFEILYFREKWYIKITKHYERLHSHNKNGGNKAYDYDWII